MKITIDLEVLKEEALEPQQYIWLFLQYQGEVGEAWSISKIDKDSLKYLEHNDYIKILGDHEEPEVILRQNAINLFIVNEPERKFAELWTTYPMKVPNGRGGYRPLRSKGLDTRDAEVLKKKYITLISKDASLHEKVMRGLNNQLEAQRHSLQYMQMLETWINQRVWERYQGEEEEEQVDNGRDI